MNCAVPNSVFLADQQIAFTTVCMSQSQRYDIICKFLDQKFRICKPSKFDETQEGLEFILGDSHTDGEPAVDVEFASVFNSLPVSVAEQMATAVSISSITEGDVKMRMRQCEHSSHLMSR